MIGSPAKLSLNNTQFLTLVNSKRTNNWYRYWCLGNQLI
jgi:hypothetical protein